MVVVLTTAGTIDLWPRVGEDNGDAEVWRMSLGMPWMAQMSI